MDWNHGARHPCRRAEEKSCMLAGAVCSQVLKKGVKYTEDELHTESSGRCTKSDQNANTKCNARLADMPWGRINPVAESEHAFNSWRAKGYNEALMYSPDPPVLDVTVQPTSTVWGLAIHGKSGTPWFESGGANIYDFIYRIPQWSEGTLGENTTKMKDSSSLADKIPADVEASAERSDYYLCDSAYNPKECGLIGGQLWDCLWAYDAKQCHYCENRSSSLVCEVRGMNAQGGFWSRVPIYPRDILGEMYRDEWRDFGARPQYAKIEIPKWIVGLRATDFKLMPPWMVETMESGPMRSAMDKMMQVGLFANFRLRRRVLEVVLLNFVVTTAIK